MVKLNKKKLIEENSLNMNFFMGKVFKIFYKKMESLKPKIQFKILSLLQKIPYSLLNHKILFELTLNPHPIVLKETYYLY